MSKQLQESQPLLPGLQLDTDLGKLQKTLKGIATKLKEGYNSVPKTIRNIIIVILLIGIFYTGGYIKGKYFSTTNTGPGLTQIITDIEENAKQGDITSTELDQGIKNTQGTVESITDQVEGIKTGVGNSIQQTGDIGEDNRDITKSIEGLQLQSGSIEQNLRQVTKGLLIIETEIRKGIKDN